MAQKIKVSITLDPQTVSYVDRLVENEQYSNRSQCIEQILRSWSRKKQSMMLHEEIATYYRQTPTKDEKEDDDFWHQLSEENAENW